MKTRRFEFSSGSSNKFWEIDLDTAIANYGKIGTLGQTHQYSLDDVQRKISEKLSKGYREVKANHKDFLERAEKTAPNFMAELRAIK